MTYKEKLTIEHPEEVRNDCLGNCNGCPCTYGYEEESKLDMPGHPCNGWKGDSQCFICWNREIPGTEPCVWCKGDWTDNFSVYDEEFPEHRMTYRHVKFCPFCGRRLEESK